MKHSQYALFFQKSGKFRSFFQRPGYNVEYMTVTATIIKNELILSLSHPCPVIYNIERSSLHLIKNPADVNAQNSHPEKENSR